MNEKCSFEISHSQSLELASQLSDFKDWNTAVAAAKSRGRMPTFITQAGKLMKILAKLEPTAHLKIWHLQRPDFSRAMAEEYKIKEDEYIVSSYSLIFEGVGEEGASFQLKLENESAFDRKGVEFDPLERIFPNPFGDNVD